MDANEKLKVKINEIATALDDDYEICFELVLVDNETFQIKYDAALNKSRPYINHEFIVENGKCMEMQIGATRAVIVAIPFKECIKILGIKDGTLFLASIFG